MKLENGIVKKKHIEVTEFTIKRGNDKDLKFIGKELACVDMSYGFYQWIEISLYKTRGGKFVCQKINSTALEDQCLYTIVDTEKEVIDFFGSDNMAKELYIRAGIDFYEEIE